MSEPERRSIVWDAIERLAFRPTKPKNWLGVYAKTLHKLWGMESTWNRFGLNNVFDIPFLDLKCDYNIETVEKYSVSLLSSSTSQHYWQSHVDPRYLSKASLHSANDRYPSQQIPHLQSDIEAVLNGMLFHPRCHTHLEDVGVRHVQLDRDRSGLSSHDVRLGGGIENPYVFLFHLRYQFCLVADQVRQAEMQRLIDLFYIAIRDNNSSVSPNDLHDFQRRNN